MIQAAHYYCITTHTLTQVWLNVRSASWEEILLFLLAICALTYNVINFMASQHGVNRVRADGVNGRILRVARQFRRNDAGRAVKQLGFLIIWIIFLMSPNASDQPATIRGIIMRLVIIGMQAWLVLGAYLDKRDREWLQHHPRTLEEYSDEE